MNGNKRRNAARLEGAATKAAHTHTHRDRHARATMAFLCERKRSVASETATRVLLFTQSSHLFRFREKRRTRCFSCVQSSKSKWRHSSQRKRSRATIFSTRAKRKNKRNDEKEAKKKASQHQHGLPNLERENANCPRNTAVARRRQVASTRTSRSASVTRYTADSILKAPAMSREQ